MFEGCEIDDKFSSGVKKLIESKSYRISRGKLRRIKDFFGMPHNGPWVFIRAIDSRQCGKWGTYHDYFNFMPEYCATKCWKVVVRVTTIKDLYALYDLSRALNFPGQ